MRRARRGLSSIAGACLLALLATGCTPTTTPPPASPSPSTSTATPTETTQEREERLAYEAAETSYREFRAEYNRVLDSGGSAKPTSTMRRFAGGSYLQEVQAGAAAYKGLQHHAEGTERIVYVRPAGYEPTELVMDICEDSRGVTTFDRRGKKLYAGDLRLLHLVFQLRESSWMIWTGSGKKVDACD